MHQYPDGLPSRSAALRSAARAATLTLAALLAGVSLSAPAEAGFSLKEAQIMGRVLGFMDQPPPSQVTVAIVYDSSTKAQADSLKAQFGSGVQAGNFTLIPKEVAIGEVAGSGANVILLMDGVSGASAIAGITKSKKLPCFTGDDSLVKSGACLIGIKTDPKVQILVNGGLAKASGISFGPAFRMMITEI